MIKQLIESDQKTWDLHIAEITFAYTTAPSDSTRLSPAYLNHGRELATPGSLSQESGRHRSGAETRLKRMHEALELAKSDIARSFTKQRHHYNLRRREWKPKEGDLVLKKIHTLSDKAKHYNAALDKKAVGPYTVVEGNPPVIFDLKDANGKITSHIHDNQDDYSFDDEVMGMINDDKASDNDSEVDQKSASLTNRSNEDTTESNDPSDSEQNNLENCASTSGRSTQPQEKSPHNVSG
ncbi:hypothetical protein QAD02_007719 [Eretmocerus hayati]|uniref:Uncharacterized protein n=1 Tax=Eretmocerus hayati TaxID=131215 RepID=A0ACC2N6W5_9HYME|nr:hypothetical protein QAD02_007719 [Eretmocerus hayati]